MHMNRRKMIASSVVGALLAPLLAYKSKNTDYTYVLYWYDKEKRRFVANSKYDPNKSYFIVNNVGGKFRTDAWQFRIYNTRSLGKSDPLFFAMTDEEIMNRCIKNIKRRNETAEDGIGKDFRIEDNKGVEILKFV